MPNVVCLLNVEADHGTFTWSEGPASFEPYTLEGMVYKDFKEIAAEAREKLADLVKDYMFDEQAMGKSAFALADAGYELYLAMFDPGADQARQAKQVRQWLEELAQQREVDTLEIVMESPWSLPWNVVYDQKPDKEAFLSGDDSPARWKPFWGLRYNLAGGRKVDPLRRMPLLEDPKVLMVVDLEIRDGLPAEQQQRLAEFADAHKFTMVHSKDALQEAIAAERPDLLYWLSHASADALVLAGEEISPRNMRKLLRQDDDENFGGLAFLNACQTAEGGESGSFFEAFHNVGFAGMIGTEHQTVDQFANPLGLDFLEAFLDRGEPVGSVLRKLRGRVPLGLLYGTYCPPDIRVDCEAGHDSLDIRMVQVQGVALSAGLAAEETATRTLPPLPDEPYRSLAYYDRDDRALFAGRDDDIERFATYLDDASTRILVLHGESGVGKSSFLRAGVIPYLEEECLGYQFIRDRETEASAGAQGSVIFIRATNDLHGQLAQALCEFCARPYQYQTPLGDHVSADLPGVLGEFVQDEPNQAIVRAVLRSDPSLLGRIMSAISDRLPFAAILVIDQGEEVFTLAQTPEDQQRSRLALDMLRRTINVAGDFKVIFCLRTEYYGRVIDRLRRGLRDSGRIREYLLTDFDEADLLEAIRRPTADEKIPYTSDVPFDRYGFRYAEGVAEEIAGRVVRYTTQRRDSVLPLMQVICAQLYRLAQQRGDKTITLTDLEQLGGIEGGMRNHVEGLLSELLKGRPLDKRPLQKLFTQLYLKQPDGTLTTALLVDDEVEKRWTGWMPFAELLRSSLAMRLLKVNSLRIGFGEERRYVSLGHDALAKLAADWDEELSRSDRFRAQVKKAAAWTSAAVVILLVTGAFVAWTLKRARADELVNQIVSADLRKLPELIDKLPKYEYRATPKLEAEADKHGDDSSERLAVSLALLSIGDQRQLDFLKERLLNASPQDFGLISSQLVEHKATLKGYYWTIAKDAREATPRRFQAACALATFDADGEDWQNNDFSEFVATHLAQVRPSELAPWREALRPVKGRLTGHLAEVYRDDSVGQQVQSFATETLADYLSENAESLFDLVIDAEESQFGVILDKLTAYRDQAVQMAEAKIAEPYAADANLEDKERLARRQANAAVLLMRLDAGQKVWPLLEYEPADPQLRSFLVHRFRPHGADPDTLGNRLNDATDVTVRRALILSLGEFDVANSSLESETIIDQLADWYRTDPDAGVHAAVAWTLRQWNEKQRLRELDEALRQNERQLSARGTDGHRWYVNTQGQTFAILDADAVPMSSRETAASRSEGENLPDRWIRRQYAISTTEVTKEQFAHFLAERPDIHRSDIEVYSQTDDSPQVSVDWYDAVAYCNWLSEKEGIPESQRCYLPKNEQYADGMQPAPDYLQRIGYRLPTEAEWEFACRAHAATTRFYGESDNLLKYYAWYLSTAKDRTWPVGSLKPNDFGLFDMLGNTWEWCHERYSLYSEIESLDGVFPDIEDTEVVRDADSRVLRGGSFGLSGLLLRSAHRDRGQPGLRIHFIGFRVARTFTP